MQGKDAVRSFAKRMPIVRTGVVGKEDVVGLLTMMMPEASDKGSQPYRNAFRCFEMAGMSVARLISACPWVGDKSGSCPLPKGKVPGVVSLTSHFAAPMGAAVWLATFV